MRLGGEYIARAGERHSQIGIWGEDSNGCPGPIPLDRLPLSPG